MGDSIFGGMLCSCCVLFITQLERPVVYGRVSTICDICGALRSCYVLRDSRGLLCTVGAPQSVSRAPYLAGCGMLFPCFVLFTTQLERPVVHDRVSKICHMCEVTYCVSRAASFLCTVGVPHSVRRATDLAGCSALVYCSLHNLNGLSCTAGFPQYVTYVVRSALVTYCVTRAACCAQ